MKEKLYLKLVRENVKLSYGEECFYTVWIKEKNDNEWFYLLSEEYDVNLMNLQILSRALNSWDSTTNNKLKTKTETYYCDTCGDYYDDIKCIIKFKDNSMENIIEEYSGHFGNGTSDEELIEQFKKNNIELSIEYID